MKIEIRKTNNAELQERRDSLLSELHARLTERDVRDLAKLGLLDPVELQLYDEVRRIEFLLDG